jgi:uncharacterized membrane protein
MMRLFAFMFIVFCIVGYTTDQTKTVLELIITIIGVVTGIYYAFFRNLDDVMP